MAPIRVDEDGPVTTITLDEPDRRNPLSIALLVELGHALQEASTSSRTRVVVLTGSGSTFCAGADIRERSGPGSEQSIARSSELIVDLYAGLMDAPKPIVAKVGGHVRGGGMGIVAAADIAVSAGDVSYGRPEVRLGVVPALVLVPLLSAVDRHAIAPKLFSGAVFDAGEAHRLGLVH